LTIRNLKYCFFTILSVILLLNLFSVIPASSAWDSRLTWNEQAVNCLDDTVNKESDYVFLGKSTTVPDYILVDYPNATARLLEAMKNNMIGMTVNQFKSFVIQKEFGYISGALSGKDLFFEVLLLKIHTPPTITTTNTSLISIRFSLYVQCQDPASIQSNSGQQTTTGSETGNGINIENNPILLVGAILGVGILGAIGYIALTSRKPNLNTEKIVERTKEVQTKQIQSLKKAIDDKATNQVKSKKSSTRRRK
jgi:hypothetical protein